MGKLFLRMVSVIVAVSFLWTNCVWAGGELSATGFLQSSKRIRSTLNADKLAAPPQVAGVGETLARHPEGARLLAGEAVVERLGVDSLGDIVENMQLLTEAGARCFVSRDADGNIAEYIIEDGALLRKTPADKKVNDKFYRALQLLGVQGKEETVDGQFREYIYVTEKNERFINSILALLSNNNPEWVVKAMKRLTSEPVTSALVIGERVGQLGSGPVISEQVSQSDNVVIGKNVVLPEEMTLQAYTEIRDNVDLVSAIKSGKGDLDVAGIFYLTTRDTEGDIIKGRRLETGTIVYLNSKGELVVDDLFEIIDSQTGMPIGEKVSGTEAHFQGKWHRTSNIVLLTEKGEMVLQERASNKRTFPSYLSIHGGHVTWGSDYKETALEELEQEVRFEDEIVIGWRPERLQLVNISKYDATANPMDPNAQPNKEYRALYVYVLNAEEETKVRAIANKLEEHNDAIKAANDTKHEVAGLVFISFEQFVREAIDFKATLQNLLDRKVEKKDLDKEVRAQYPNQPKYTPDLAVQIVEDQSTIDRIKELVENQTVVTRQQANMPTGKPFGQRGFYISEPLIAVMILSVVGILVYTFREGILAWILERTIGEYVISGLVGVGLLVALYFIIWRYVFPVSWYLWRLKSKDWKVRKNSAKALGKLGDIRAVEPLLELLDDKDSDVRKAIREVLNKLGVKRDQLVTVYIKALESYNLEVKRESVIALGKLGDVRAIEPIINCLKRLKEECALVEPRMVEITIPMSCSGCPDSVYVTGEYELNPRLSYLYEIISDVMKSIETLSGNLIFNINNAVNTSLVVEAIGQRKMVIAHLPYSLIQFLLFLKENNLENIVVIGGSMRDVFFGKEPEDFDITVRLKLSHEEKERIKNGVCPERVFDFARLEIEKLAKALGVSVDELYKSSLEQSSAIYEGKRIDFVGPLMVTSKRGERSIVPRMLIDAETGECLYSSSGAGILRIAIDSEGLLSGDVNALNYLKENRVNISGDGEKLNIGGALSLLRLKYEFGLNLSPFEYILIGNAIAVTSYIDTEVLSDEFVTAFEIQYNKIVERAKDRSAAQKELDDLGITSFLEQLKKRLNEMQRDKQSQLSTVLEGPEAKILQLPIDNRGAIGAGEITGDLAKLAGILGVNTSQVPETVQARLQGVLDSVKKAYPGILGAAKQIVLVDNLGGIDPIRALTTAQAQSISNGASSLAVFQNGVIAIDIDAFRDDRVLYDVVLHELWHSILEIVEKNKGVEEAAAIYQSLLYFAELSAEEQAGLITFLKQKDNGLDSVGYADLLQMVQEKGLKGEALIPVAISYVLSEERYAGIREGLIEGMDGEVKKAVQKLKLATEVYQEIIQAIDKVPAVGKVKNAVEKSKILMKVKMIASRWSIDTGFIDKLKAQGKYVQLDVNELEKNPHMVDWLKRLTVEQQGAFIFKSGGEISAADFMQKNGLQGIDAGEIENKGIQRGNIITLLELGVLDISQDMPDNSGLYLPYIYSVTGIYLAAQVILANGKFEDIEDNLVKTTLMATLGLSEPADLDALFRGKWPKLFRVSEIINELREAIRLTETAA